MNTFDRVLLIIDGCINLCLGVLLLLFPIGVADLLGVPIPESHFYPSLLGAVLFGIGIALMIESYGTSLRLHGLGIAGAISINFCGAGVLSVWLFFMPLDLPLRGKITLGAIAIGVLAIGVVEWLHSVRKTGSVVVGKK